MNWPCLAWIPWDSRNSQHRRAERAPAKMAGGLSLTRLHTPREIPIRLDATEEHQQVLA